MKIKILLLVLLCLSALALAIEQNVDDSMSIAQISAIKEVPIPKLIEYLNFDRAVRVNINAPLRDLGRTNEDIQGALTKYKNNSLSFHVRMVTIGMLTVIFSLLLVSVFIIQLRRFSNRMNRQESEQAGKKLKSFSSSEPEAMAAAIAIGIYMHELELKSRSKLQLTWTRNTHSSWKAANFIPMNEIDPSRRK
jgi:predicted PurR-regulated permease PerM